MLTTNNNLCCIIIPIYKNYLTDYEILSLKQCCKILNNYKIIFVTYKKIDCSIYNDICNSFNVIFNYEYFNKYYFNNIIGYNSLLISKNFYLRFKEYKYILIYQLDAYVFRDELEYWCNKEYDFIGAPWLKLDKSKPTVFFQEIYNIGNGGFSLRNTKNSLKKINYYINILSVIRLFFSFYFEISNNRFKNILNLLFFIFLFIPNKIIRIIFFKSKFLKFNEDFIWSRLFYKDKNIPSPLEASQFSFELYPEYLFILNNNKLPFGCHSWYSYYNYFFYKNHIT